MPNPIPLCSVNEPHCEVLASALDELNELRQQVVTDPLTGLYNVAHMRESLNREFERTRRTGVATSFIMVDLDHFKQVNDTYGHEAGNRVLKRVAHLLQHETRQLDICCRYGGEEFAAILPSTELILAKTVAERFRKILELNPIELEQTQLQVTASIGLAVCRDSHRTSVEQLIEQADQCLYMAKKAGRNQVQYRTEDWNDSAQVSQDEKNALGSLFSDSP